jgi:putative phosphoesterase
MILVCSDIHGSKRAGDLIKTLDSNYNFEKIIILGDFLYNGPRNKVPSDYDPNYLIDVFNSLKNKIVAVRGNCDADVDLMVLKFEIPKFREEIIKINGIDYKFFLTHGDIEDLYIFEPKNNEIIIKGHTHIKVFKRNENGGITLNPGSMTFPKNHPSKKDNPLNKSFIIIDENVRLYEFEYDENDNAKILNTHSLNDGQFIE